MRLFVAVWPDDAALATLASLTRPDIHGVRWTTPDQWHLTLRFLGEVDDVMPIERALRAAVVDVERVTAVLGPTVTRVGSMLWAPVAGLDSLAAAVIDATRDVGAPPEIRPFRGHVMLARRRGSRSGQGQSLTAGEPIEASWLVRAIDLVCSDLQPEGARYETLEGFVLGG